MSFSNSYLFAEREGFEPSEQLPVHRISSAARSTTPASFLYFGWANIQTFRFRCISLPIFITKKHLPLNIGRDVVKCLSAYYFCLIIIANPPPGAI